MKHIIWTYEVNAEDFLDDFVMCHDREPEDDYELEDFAQDVNNDYWYDEKMNLNQDISEQIICIADIGAWNGRFSGYRILGHNLGDIFSEANYFSYDTYYDDGKDIRKREAHHDGVNFYIFRALRAGRDHEKFLDRIVNNETITPDQLSYHTRSIHPDVAKIYGWS